MFAGISSPITLGTTDLKNHFVKVPISSRFATSSTEAIQCGQDDFATLPRGGATMVVEEIYLRKPKIRSGAFPGQALSTFTN